MAGASGAGRERSARAPTLDDPAVLAKRLAALSAPHVAALEALREAIAARHGETPHFDPFDGGVEARVLLLLETPGPGRLAPSFVSRDNPTGTAANIRRFSAAAGLDRRDTVIWNAVPWVIHAPGARNRAPRSAEIATGLLELPDLVARLPRLRAAVLAGRVAGAAEALLARLAPDVLLLRMPHPSPTFVNTAPAIAPGMVACLRQAAEAL